MTEDEIDRIEDLAKAATPGPWLAEIGGGRGSWIKGSTDEWSAMSCGDSDASAEANAAFIVALVNAWPSLLSALRARDAEIGAGWLVSQAMQRMLTAGDHATLNGDAEDAIAKLAGHDRQVEAVREFWRSAQALKNENYARNKARATAAEAQIAELVAALREAIAQVAEHDSDYQHRTPTAMIERWVAALANSAAVAGAKDGERGA